MSTLSSGRDCPTAFIALCPQCALPAPSDPLMHVSPPQGGDCKGISRQTVVPSTDASKQNTGEATGTARQLHNVVGTIVHDNGIGLQEGIQC